ncbi:hypothetical protein [Leifsonia sp. TF02-11]|uniref:hypothetical protein n=1 Tax=Leifsonia sp. TF02-11 TaxID=2815212 RepID=UPI001AA0D2DF|nr:hypothetical protein [Leifsonia sp. TF02-11]MBO1741264.1 hypothetical protein [Leifsonia sp. TF02-11]
MRTTVGAVVVALVLALLTGCGSAQPDRTDGVGDGLVLPSLSVRHHALDPYAYGYRLDGATRRSMRDAHAGRQHVAVSTRDRLRLRLVSGFRARVLYVGAFEHLDAHGGPTDGGDQYDCLTGPACTQTPRAGSLSIEVPIRATTRAIVARSRFELPDHGTLDVVWRFELQQT